MIGLFPTSLRAVLLGLLSVSIVAAGCAGPTAKTPASRESYRVSWKVSRAGDKISLASVTSPPVHVNAGEFRVQTGLQRAEENRPAFPEFIAKLSTLPQRGVIQLITRVTVLDATRTKKGKLKVHKRFIGALLPIRTGEKLGVNGPGDPLMVEVELAPAR